MKKFFQLCFLLLISFQVYGQKLKTLIAEGNKALEDKEYYLAENYFKKAIATDSNSIALQYLYAEACRLDLNYTVAERWYNKVYKKDNGKLYPDALLYLAICKKSNGKYKDAIKMFDKYAKRNTKKHPEKSAVAAQESKNCSYALMLMKNPLPLLVNHIDSMVNSKGGEYAPFEKDSVLYFTGIKTAGNKIDSRIYYSKVSGYRFSKLVELDSLLRKEGVTISNVVLTPDGKQLYCT
ncbi:MAG: tetratricopeptide repeat protein, partial [Bacteroidota bacterium]